MCSLSMSVQLTLYRWCCDTQFWGRLCSCGFVYPYIRFGFPIAKPVSPTDDISSCVGRCVRASCIQRSSCTMSKVCTAHQWTSTRRFQTTEEAVMHTEEGGEAPATEAAPRERLLTELGAIMRGIGAGAHDPS